MILIGTHDEDSSEKAYLVQELSFINSKLVPRSDVMEEEVVAHS